MKKRRIPRTIFIWLAALLIYICFLLWHNGLGIPLSEEEIEKYITRARAINPDVDPEKLEALRAFLNEDDGDALIMVNAIKLRDKPMHSSDVSPDETSMRVLSRYNRFVMPFLLKRGGYPVLVGIAVADSPEVWGIENAEKWTMAGMIRYRSRRDMMDMATNPEFQKVHKFKVAAVEKTFGFPMSPRFIAGGGLEIAVPLFLFSVAAFSHLTICIYPQRQHQMESETKIPEA
jgi:hypothetical protein